MEPGSITDKLIQNHQRSQIEKIMAISKVLGLKIGSQFLADVQKVTQVAPEERAQLIKAIEANLAQLNRNSAAPAIKALISELEAQKQLVQTPNVKLVTLSVNTPTPVAANTLTSAATPSTPLTTSLLTYTNQPIQIGQTLLIQINEGQRLQLLQVLTRTEVVTFNALLQSGHTPTATSGNTPVNTQLQNTINPASAQSTSVSLNNEIIHKNLPASLEQQKIATTKTTEAIGETLRRLLPQKDKGQDLLTSLPKITQFIQQLPLAERKEWLSSQVQQSLKTLANHIRLSDQLTNPKLVEMTLKNNGQSFEQKLAQLVTRPQPAETSPIPTGSNPSADKKSLPATPLISSHNANGSLLKTNKSALIQPKPVMVQQHPVEKIASQDLKGALLGLLHQLDTELETAKPAPPGTALTTELNKNPLVIALPQFLGMLAHKQQGELSQKQLRTQLVMLLHQHTLGSIAKIQLQQVHTLNHQLTQADQAQPTQSWQFEIPVRQGQDVHPLHIQLEQQWTEEQDENSEKSSTRVRQWNVMLSFALPIVGQFYVQLSLLGESLSAKFWAEHENTLRETKNKIDGLKTQLEREGIQVTQMQCVPGLPPKPKMSFSYSLVDIKT